MLFFVFTFFNAIVYLIKFASLFFETIFKNCIKVVNHAGVSVRIFLHTVQIQSLTIDCLRKQNMNCTITAVIVARIDFLVTFILIVC